MDVRSILLCVLIPAAVYAQEPELVRMELTRYTGTLTLDAPRPLDSAAKTLAQHYGIIINSEDPEYLYSDDIKDVTPEVVRTPRPGLRVFIPKGGRLEAEFAVNADGRPQDAHRLLRTIVDAANAHFPFAYQLALDGDTFTFVPTKTRDLQGRIVDKPALLDT